MTDGWAGPRGQGVTDDRRERKRAGDTRVLPSIGLMKDVVNQVPCASFELRVRCITLRPSHSHEACVERRGHAHQTHGHRRAINLTAPHAVRAASAIHSMTT